MDKQVFTITLTVTVDGDAWAGEYGIEPTVKAVREDFAQHAKPNFDTTVGNELEPGHIVTAWDCLVTEVTAVVK
jgi:hypothetical protein